MRLVETFKTYLHDKPKVRKTVGVILIIIGLAALVTPLTPGSWLALIGLELLGWRILLYSRLKFWKKKQNSNSSDLPTGR